MNGLALRFVSRVWLARALVLAALHLDALPGVGDGFLGYHLYFMLQTGVLATAALLAFGLAHLQAVWDGPGARGLLGRAARM